MRQRLGFAQSLVNDPAYLFLDEPLDGLDPIGRHDLKESMLALKHEGRRIFLNTHILYDVQEICDEVGIIHEGKLLYAGSVKDFCAGRPLEERFVEIVQEHEKSGKRRQRKRSMKNIFIIARNTVKLEIRGKIWLALLVFGLGYLAIMLFLSDLVLKELPMVKAFALFGIYFFNVVIAIFLGTTSFYRDVERKTVYFILAKPVSRAQFLVGKFLGLAR